MEVDRPPARWPHHSRRSSSPIAWPPRRSNGKGRLSQSRIGPMEATSVILGGLVAPKVKTNLLAFYCCGFAAAFALLWLDFAASFLISSWAFLEYGPLGRIFR